MKVLGNHAEPFVKLLYRGLLLHLADFVPLLLFRVRFHVLPREVAAQKVDEDVSEGFEVVPS